MATRPLPAGMVGLCQSTFGGPQAVIEYLGRYTHKVAISNQRIINIEDQQVLFRYKDYRQQGQQKVMALSAVEFLRRFCQHILPPGFRRMRHYGILSNRAKADALAAARKALQQSPIPSFTRWQLSVRHCYAYNQRKKPFLPQNQRTDEQHYPI